MVPRMKNNKGYTLVELLVTLAVFAIIMAEVGNMMMNSSKLYRNGTYEVELQTEAQQIVQQMEELLIDVNHSVSANWQASLSSDFITISNNDAIYNFQLEDMDLTRGYGTLYFYKESLDGGADVNHVPMAEYVQSISLNMEGYTSDVVTLNVSMNNGRYGYQASQDIYLRNGVGSGGKYNYASGGTFNTELNVLRYKKYDLAALFNTDDEKFTYAWDMSDLATYAYATTRYRLSNPNDMDAATLETTSWYNSNDAAEGPFVLIGTGTNGTTLTIKVSTDKVGDGSAVIYQNTSSSYHTMAPVIVKGINIASDKITNVTINAVYAKDNLFDTAVQIPLNVNLSDVYVREADYQDLTFEFYPNVYSSDKFVKVQIQDVFFCANENDNTIEVHSGRFFDLFVGFDDSNPMYSGVAYYYYIDYSNAPIYYDVHVEYENGWQELDMKLYLLPTPSAADVPPMHEDIATKFWSAAGM